MARPLSEEKRAALLSAAVDEVASYGVAASTSRIAKSAGVAEGTLFIYFSTKDGLLNQLFLSLKADLIASLTAGFPSEAGIPEQFRHIWNGFVDWGANHPDKSKALRQLSVSERIDESTRQAGDALFDELYAVVEKGFRAGILREQPVGLLGGIIRTLADLVLDLAAKEPTEFGKYKEWGWEAAWGAISLGR